MRPSVAEGFPGLPTAAIGPSGQPGAFLRRALFWAAHHAGYHPFRPTATTVRRVRYRGAHLDVLADEDVGWELVAKGEFEGPELDALLPLVRPGDLCIDAGANIGVYSILMALRARAGRVLAVEPLEKYHPLLARNAALNGVDNVRPVHAALAAASGQTLFSEARDGGYSSLRATGRRKELRASMLSALTLDELVGGARAGVLKIDVEGAELVVLQGGVGLLGDPDRRPRAVLVELNPLNQSAFGHAPASVVSFLRGLGYEPWSITRKGLHGGWPRPGARENVLFLAPGAGGSPA